jgi:hypothetical protein
MLVRVSRPVLAALAGRRLKATMPVQGKGDPRFDRKLFSHLEALARTLAGLAPWLDAPGLSGAECELRDEMAELARQGMALGRTPVADCTSLSLTRTSLSAALDAATDPASPDYVNFSESFQPIVDAAFLAHAILRAPQVRRHR